MNKELRFIGILAGCLLMQHCAKQTQFTEMPASSTGIFFTNEIIETDENNILTYEYTYNGGGVAVGDFNNDDLADIYFSANVKPNTLFLNQGNWMFTDVAFVAGVTGRPDGWKTGVTTVDINGDGWLDIYVCYSGNAPGEGMNKPVIHDYPNRANQLFINNGCEKGGMPTFTERAKEFGIDAPGTFSTQGYFFDYDKDGDLDLFLLNHANMFYAAYFDVKKRRSLRHPYFGNILYRNEGKEFIEVSSEAGIHGSALNFGLSAAISDLNGDGWPDIYVTNDYEEQDFCYLNNHDGKFTEASHSLFAHLSKFGMGSDIADVNNDGLPDIFVADMLPEDNYRQKLLKGADEYDKVLLAADSGYHFQYMRNTLQINRGVAPDGKPRFSELAQLAGVSNTDWSWAPLFADFDNDGWKDLFVTNGYLRDFTNMDFLKYKVSDSVRKESKGSNLLKLVQQMPSTKLTEYIFTNTDGIRFQNKTNAWGLTQKAISNAAAYADLDNDGDLDLVVNNLNEPAALLQNHEREIGKNNFIKIKLVGKTPNRFGIGAKVTLASGGRIIFQEAYFTRGYQSSVEPVLTIGLGKSSSATIRVQWPDDTETIIENAATNRTYEIEQADALKSQRDTQVAAPAFLHDVTQSSGLNFKHEENTFIDFKLQRLLLTQLSKLGGKLAVADVNKDGNDDVFFGAASGKERKLFLGKENGKLIEASSQPWNDDKMFEDTGVTFFDAEGDGDADLYLVSGGNEFLVGDKHYQDRLFLNDGTGFFSQTKDALPLEETSGSCAVAADYDKDGDLDLFIGGRLVAQNYPLSPKSFLLRNDSKDGKIRFTNVTRDVCPSLSTPGMVTDAVWSDVNNDTWPDLLVVGEWMPVRIFINQRGKLNEAAQPGLEKNRGWWSVISPIDVDGDGDTDYLLGNAGLNMQLHASQDEPVDCYALDINQDGAIDPIVCYYIQGTSFPLASRDELLDQVTTLRKKFIHYADYAGATIEDIINKDQISSAQLFKAETFQSSWLENTGSGNLKLKSLPLEAQTSMINGFVKEDFDGDGESEVLAAGNFFPYRVNIGRCDASMGVLLKFKNGESHIYKYEQPLWLAGDIRGIAMMKFKDGIKRLVVSRNNDSASLFQSSSATKKSSIK